MLERESYHCRIWKKKWILIWQLMMMGALFGGKGDQIERAETGDPSSSIEAEQVIHIPRKTPEENLMVGLIKEFANLQNVTQITACLPIPRAVGESIPWGIIMTNLSDGGLRRNNTHCEQVSKQGWREQLGLVPKTKPVNSKEECDELGVGPMRYPLHKYRRAGEVNPWTSEPGGVCYYAEQIKKDVSQMIMEWKCRETNQTKQEVEVAWDSVWSMTILSQFQYIANASWCFTWDGTVFTALSVINDKETTSREKENIVSWWSCKKIYNCSTVNRAIQDIPPLAAALKYGYWCRGLKNDLVLTDPYKIKKGVIFSCRRSTIQSPGHLVWAMSDRTWTTHLSMDGKVKQITLGMPTLCPIWKKAPFKGNFENLKLIRTKRSQTDDTEWNEPSAGVKIGWALESLLTPLSTYRNKAWLYRLTGQVEKLANVTRKGFKQLNLQLQATSKMTLQNRMALDMLLLKEHGVCGYLRDRTDHCCIHIPNVTQDVEHDLDLLGQIEKDTQEIQKDMQENWFDKIFSGLGWNLSSWVKSLIGTVLLLLIIFLVILLIYHCLKKEFTKRAAVDRKITLAIAEGRHQSLNGSTNDAPTIMQ